jgi:hypothetical protein
LKLAIVVGGWHWPKEFFAKLTLQSSGADLFVIAHRNPELPIVWEEKLAKLFDVAAIPNGVDQLFTLDQKLYRSFPSVHGLRLMCWNYIEEPNTVGDWGFFNQWLARHDYRKYDLILNCHDDNWIRRPDLVDTLVTVGRESLLLSNGRYPQAPAGYVRGSFEVWNRQLLDALGGKIDLGPIGLTREGKTDSPLDAEALMAWNDTATPLRRFMVDRGLESRIGYLSEHYRVSPWVIEGERGFLHYQGGAPWSFNAGLEAHPLQEHELV